MLEFLCHGMRTTNSQFIWKSFPPICPENVLIGQMSALLASVPKLASSLGSGTEDAHHAAVAITTTDLVSKSAALEVWSGYTHSGCAYRSFLIRSAQCGANNADNQTTEEIRE